MGLFDFAKYDADAPGTTVDEETRLELRRVANLFLLSSLTLVVLLLQVVVRALQIEGIPQVVYSAAGFLFLVGWATTYVYGLYTTVKARRWTWVVLCVIPFMCVPASVAYAWIRRGEIEREVLAARGRAGSRRRRGGGKKR